jgi:hypothetical protein
MELFEEDWLCSGGSEWMQEKKSWQKKRGRSGVK